MHLFHDSTLNTWKLITDKLPDNETGQCGWTAYREAIDALKQNALTVGNQEACQSLVFYEKSIWENGVKPDELYFWPGKYYKAHKEEGWVAILTLPEEKKNTMENMTKEPHEEYTSRLLPCPFCGGKPGYDVFFAGYITAGNYQVKCIACTLEIRQDRVDKVIGMWNTRTDFKQFTLYKDHPTTASGSVAAPKEEPMEESERIFSGSPEEILDSLKSTDDAYYHHSQLESVISLLQSELAAAKESIKELLPMAEDGYTLAAKNGAHQEFLKDDRKAISCAKAILDKQ